MEQRAKELWTRNTFDQLRVVGSEWPEELTWENELPEFKGMWRNIAGKELTKEREFSEAADRGARALYELEERSWFLPKRRRWTMAGTADRQKYRKLAEAVLKAAQQQ